LAAAFAPMGRVSTRPASLKMGYEKEIGAQAPLGFWDPLGILNDADEARFKRLREVETKHGRIAMLAIVGHMVTAAGVRLPGSYGDVPISSIGSGLKALSDLPKEGLGQLVVFIGLLEWGFSLRKQEFEDLCLKSGPFTKFNEATQRSKLAIELNNGRAAQMGILALMVHEKLDNNPYIINDLLGAPVKFN
jgi:hypothetical protein